LASELTAAELTATEPCRQKAVYVDDDCEGMPFGGAFGK